MTFRLPVISSLVLTGLFPILLIFGGYASAQQAAALLEKRIVGYSEKAAAEKIYVHVDRPAYIAGESIWFSIYCTDEQHHLSDLSKVAYIELLDKDKKAAIQAKVAMKGGKGDGTIQIPATLLQGHYLLRAYTRWMKNFTADHFFETAVSIINPFISALPPDEAPSSSQPDVRFMPEGGHLVAGLENTIGFRATGKDGKGIPFRGQLIDQDGTVITGFEPLAYGIGRFRFTPAPGKTYRAEVIDPSGHTFSYPLPVPLQSGFALHVSEKDRHILVSVKASAGIPDTELHLLAYQGSESVARSAAMQNGTAVFEIDKHLLKTGVNALAVFTGQLRPVAERLWFHRSDKHLQLQVAAEKNTYQPREQITINLAVSPGDSAEMSVSVYLSDSIPEPGQTGIEAYLLMSSELKGEIEDPDYYFKNTDAKSDEALDNLMLTHGWRRYQWNLLAGDKDFQPEYLPEKYAQLISGKVVSAATGRPLAHRAAYAAIPSSRIQPFFSLSDSFGRILFETRPFEGQGVLVTLPHPLAGSDTRVYIDNPFSEQLTDNLLPVLTLDPSAAPDIQKRSINMQTLNAYFPRPRKSVPVDSSAFYLAPDVRYYLDEYTRFPTMEEILREYVPSVMVRKRQGKFHLKVVETGVHRQVFNEDPLVLIDGVPFFDMDYVMSLDPLRIKRADIMTRQYYVGPLAFSGIISFATYTGDLSDFETDPRALVLAYEGTLKHREFYSPAYDKPVKHAERLPDLRNLLFWSPSVRTGADGRKTLSFYASDQPGKYKIIVQGISAKGLPGSSTSFLEVRKTDLP